MSARARVLVCEYWWNKAAVVGAYFEHKSLFRAVICPQSAREVSFHCKALAHTRVSQLSPEHVRGVAVAAADGQAWMRAHRLLPNLRHSGRHAGGVGWGNECGEGEGEVGRKPGVRVGEKTGRRGLSKALPQTTPWAAALP